MQQLSIACSDEFSERHLFALSLRAAGDLEASLAVTEAILAQAPDHQPSLVAKIDTLLLDQRPLEALAAARSTLIQRPDDRRLQIKLAATLRQVLRPQESVAALQALLQVTNPNDLAVRHQLALSLRAAGDVDASLAVTEAILVQAPDHQPSLLARIDTLYLGQRPLEALAAARSALGQRPDDRRLQIKHAVTLRQVLRPQESVDALQALQAFDPNDLTVRHQLALSLRAAGDVEASLAVTEAILAQAPDHQPSLLARIDTLFRDQRPLEALAAASSALDQRPDDRRLQLKHAVTLRQVFRPQESVAALEALLASDPTDLTVRHQLALSLRAAGDVDASLAVTEAILTQAPDHQPSLLARIDTLFSDQRPLEALAAASSALDQRPDDRRLQLKHAVTLRQVLRPQESVDALQALQASDPTDLTVRHQLALSLRAAGDVDASLAVTEAILAQAPDHQPSLLARIDTLRSGQDVAGLEGIVESELMLGLATSDHRRKLSAAESICRALPHLSPTARPMALRRAAPLVNSVAHSLSTASLWGVCQAADVSGTSREYRDAALTLLQHERLSLGICRAILMHLYRGGDPDWLPLSESMGRRLTPDDAWLYRLDLMALSQGAERALATRKTSRAPAPGPAIVLTIERLLQQAGKPRLAERYLRRARRAYPLHSSILNAHVRALITVGKAEEARHALDTAQARSPCPEVTHQVMRANFLLQIGELNEALDLLEGIEIPEVRQRQLGSILHALFGLGRVEVALRHSVEVKRSLPAKTAAHFGLTLNGVLLTERLVLGKEAAANDIRDSALAAARSISSWRQQGCGGGHSSIPVQVMQYWNTSKPPEDVASIMLTWERSKGIIYHRFDHLSARRYLTERLGCQWEQAFCSANSPTEGCDFFRLCWLMLEGGLYVDCDDRLIGEALEIFSCQRGLTVFVEPYGFISNNFILAPARHPAIVWAAVAARKALVERHNDSTWIKTGPGLMSRAVAWYLSSQSSNADPIDLMIRPRWELGKHVQYHVPLPYKGTRRYWNAAGKLSGTGNVLLDVYRSQKEQE